MFNLTFRTNMIAAAIFSLFLLSFVGNSEAIEIETLVPYSGSYEEYDYGYYHTAYIRTDEPFYDINWYLDGHYVGRTDGNNIKTEVYFNFFGLGSIKGKKYTIKATAWSMDADGNTASDTKFYEMTIFTPAYKSKCIGDGICGHVELTRQYYDGSSIAVDYYAYADKLTKGKSFASTVYTHAVSGIGHIERRHPTDEFMNAISHQIGPNREPYSHSDTIAFGDVGSGTVDGEYMSQAYIRLIVDGNQETFYVPSTQTFVNGEEPFNDPN